jgi:hypothetical protein
VIEQEDVRTELPREPDGLGPAGGFANHEQLGIRFEQLAERFAEERMIVRDEDPD